MHLHPLDLGLIDLLAALVNPEVCGVKTLFNVVRNVPSAHHPAGPGQAEMGTFG